MQFFQYFEKLYMSNIVKNCLSRWNRCGSFCTSIHVSYNIYITNIALWVLCLQQQGSWCWQPARCV